MAGGGGKERSMEVTPTWAVAVVCFVLVAISIVIEHAIDHVGSWLKKRHKQALCEALEKIKAELMLLGFTSLLLTVTGEHISKICIPEKYGKTWHPCKKEKEEEYDDKCSKGRVPFMTSYAIHQLHVFIFVLALFHVLYCITTLGLGTLKMKRWKVWEDETNTIEYQFNHGEERFRFARETSFGRRHLKFWSRSNTLLWMVCFFRQFFHSVKKVDYLTLRHGFITAHLAPQSQGTFDFQKYISRSLEEDFKVVVGISPIMWLFAVLFLLTNTHGWYSYLWLPFVPLIILLVVGAKLQVIITKMGVRILERGDVVKGTPLVQPGDGLFWFSRPRLILHLIHFVLLANAYQLGFFFYSWYEFGFRGCFHQRIEDIVIRLSMGVIIQVLCSYVALPLYALVTQMGSTVKPTIFNDQVASAVPSCHHTAEKQAKHKRHIDGSAASFSFSSRPETPMHGIMSPAHLLQGYQDSNINAVDSLETSPRTSNVDVNELRKWDAAAAAGSQHEQEIQEFSSTPQPPPPASGADQHQVQISLSEFSFNTK